MDNRSGARESERLTGKIWLGWDCLYYLSRVMDPSKGVLLSQVHPETYELLSGAEDRWVSERALGRTFHRPQRAGPRNAPRLLRLEGKGLGKGETGRVCTVSEFCAVGGIGGPDALPVVRKLVVGEPHEFPSGVIVTLIPIWWLPAEDPAQATVR